MHIKNPINSKNLQTLECNSERGMTNFNFSKFIPSFAKALAFIFVLFLFFGLQVERSQAAQITVYATANSIKWMGTNAGWNTNPDGVSGTFYSNPQNNSTNTFIVDLNGKSGISLDTDIVVDKIQDSTATASASPNATRTISVLNGGIYYSGTNSGGLIASSFDLTVLGTITSTGSGKRVITTSSTAKFTINAGVGNTAVLNQGTSYAIIHNGTGQLTVIGKVIGKITTPAVYSPSSANQLYYNPGNDVFSDGGATAGGACLQHDTVSSSIIAVGNINGSSANGSNVNMIRNDAGAFELIGNIIITGSAVHGIYNHLTSISHVYGNVDVSGSTGATFGVTNDSATTGSTITGNISNPSGSPTAVAVKSTTGMVTIYGTKSGSGTVNSATYTTIATTYVSVSPTSFPAGATGLLDASITGVGTSWNGSETPTINNSVSGSTAVSAGSWTSSDTTHGTLPLQNSATSSFGTFSITIGTATSGPLAVLPPSFILSQTTGSISNSYNLTLTGINTRWSTDIAKGNHTAANLFSASTGGTITNVVVSNDNSVTLTLATDATQRVITITDNSTNQTTTFDTNNILTYDLSPTGGVVSNYVMIEGGMRWDGGRWISTALTSGIGTPLGAVRFVGKINKIDGYITQTGSAGAGNLVILNIDGENGPTYSVPYVAGGTFPNAWLTMFSGLDDTTTHTYMLIWPNGEVVGNPTVGKIRTTGGTGISTTALVPRPVLAVYGDSITQGGAYESSPHNSTLYYAYLLAKKLNYQVVNLGISGSTVTSLAHGGLNPTTKNGVSRTADIASLSPTASIVLILYGTNDVTFNTNQGGTPTEANFLADYTSMLASIRAGNPNALIIAERILMTSRADEALRNTWSQTDIAAAVSAQSDPKILYMHGGWDNYQDTSGSDGVHPLPTKNQAIADGMYADIISAITSTNSIQVSTASLSGRGNTTATITSTGGIYGTAPYTYQWLRSATSSWSGFQVVGATATTLNDTGLDPSSTYYYTLQATDSNGLSALSNPVLVGPASNDASLSNLVISEGTLSPAFSSSTSSYTVNVLNGITSLTVTPTANQADATITVNGITVASGATSSPITLNVGDNTVLTVTLAQDESTTQTYTITVTRGAPIVVPPTVTVQDASFVATSSAVLNGTIIVDGYASSTVVGFYYGTTLSYGSVASTTGIFDTESFSLPITGLTPDTLYHYQAFAQNSGGTGTSSDATTTTTSAPLDSIQAPSVQSTPRSQGTSAQNRVKNLIAMGNIEAANELKKQYAYLFPNENPKEVTKPASSISVFTRDLRFGMTGSDVKKLQQYLNNNGFVIAKSGVGSKGKENTRFGPATKAALIKFQKANKITPAIGYFGPVTRGVILGN